MVCSAWRQTLGRLRHRLPGDNIWGQRLLTLGQAMGVGRPIWWVMWGMSVCSTLSWIWMWMNHLMSFPPTRLGWTKLGMICLIVCSWKCLHTTLASKSKVLYNRYVLSSPGDVSSTKANITESLVAGCLLVWDAAPMDLMSVTCHDTIHFWFLSYMDWLPFTTKWNLIQHRSMHVTNQSSRRQPWNANYTVCVFRCKNLSILNYCGKWSKMTVRDLSNSNRGMHFLLHSFEITYFRAEKRHISPKPWKFRQSHYFDQSAKLRGIGSLKHMICTTP